MIQLMLLNFIRSACAFEVLPSTNFLFPTHRNLHSRTQLSSSHQYDIEGALALLLWETLLEVSNRPVLDLSARDASPETAAVGNKESPSSETVSNSDRSLWDQGQRWNITKLGLVDLGVHNPDRFIEKCPQLLRLESTMVIETAKWIIHEFTVAYLESEPRLLSYPVSSVSYGMEFIGTMMMLPDAKPVCRASPELLLGGIEGGLQEQAVKNALGAASEATRQANQKIAGDAAASWKELKQRKRLS